MNDKGGPRNPVVWLLRVSLALLGASVALNVAVGFLQPVVPWLAGGFVIGLLIWCVAAYIRWRRSRW
ncbi:hypothetical protein [Amycolatopsis dendrobii]|uniref:Uncharacterized protein n=1 Tax=Amycolatopsis dendrobii TaxID=2760662 RepID=A0A7W3VSU1_9PSEU|nr:hypothetical protein [Amycolatopsis dendrobii]MBB1152465.1 hypothetical protein [Amycolatopsis dendrobii]